MGQNFLRFAFAVNNTGNFEAKHFGDADKYLIYEWGSNELHFIKEEINVYKTLDEEKEHGSVKKGMAIIELLKTNNVNVLVSRQFGKNIHLVNQHFIPVIVYTEMTDEVLGILHKHIRWINDELLNNKGNFRLFTIKNGIVKKSLPDAIA